MNETLLKGNKDAIIRLIIENRKKDIELAKESLKDFILWNKKDYSMKWFHELTCIYLDKLQKGEILKLMIFFPPQHGKSEISSRQFPAYSLGKEPDLKIGLCSYTADLSFGFNRNVQGIIDNPLYRQVFPATYLNTPEAENTNGEAKNKHIFETVGKKGFLKAVGVAGPLTGTALDLGIIDDPFKDREEARSETIRNKVWNWYQDVFCTRLHNTSKQLLLFTRWHEDDIAGRLLDPNNEHYDEEEAKEWTVIAIPALKEAVKPIPQAIDIDDPREIDEALWEEKHSAKKYFKRRRVNPIGFASLDQQRPKALGGNLIAGEWFQRINETRLPFNMNSKSWQFIIDGAFTEDANNDPSAVMSYCMHLGNMYIRKCIEVRKEMHGFLKFFPEWAKSHGYRANSAVRIEPKASGLPFISMLRTSTYGGLNAVRIRNKHVRYGKYLRVENSLPTLESGKVFLIEGDWVPRFIDQCEAFPNGVNDDMVDDLTYAIHHEFIDGFKKKGVKYREE